MTDFSDRNIENQKVNEQKNKNKNKNENNKNAISTIHAKN